MNKWWTNTEPAQKSEPLGVPKQLSPCSVHSPVLLSNSLVRMCVGNAVTFRRGELPTAQRTEFMSMSQAAILHKRQTGKPFLRQEGKRDPMLSFALQPLVLEEIGMRRAFRNKHEILHWQEGTYWLENFPVLVKALFPIQPNTQVLSALFSLCYFFNRFKHGIRTKASKDLLPTLLAVFSKASVCRKGQVSMVLG